MWLWSFLPSCPELLESPQPTRDLSPQNIMSTETISLSPSFLHTPLSIHPSPLFSCSLLSQKAVAVALKPADALSSLLCTEWPFPQQYIHLWLHWPLPTVQPPLISPRSGLQTAHCLCIHAERKPTKDRGKSWTGKWKWQLRCKIDAEVEGECTVGFHEELVGWLFFFFFFCQSTSKNRCLGGTLSRQLCPLTCSLGGGVWGRWVQYATNELVRMKCPPNAFKGKWLLLFQMATR